MRSGSTLSVLAGTGCDRYGCRPIGICGALETRCLAAAKGNGATRLGGTARPPCSRERARNPQTNRWRGAGRRILRPGGALRLHVCGSRPTAMSRASRVPQPHCVSARKGRSGTSDWSGGAQTFVAQWPDTRSTNGAERRERGLLAPPDNKISVPLRAVILLATGLDFRLYARTGRRTAGRF